MHQSLFVLCPKIETQYILMTLLSGYEYISHFELKKPKPVSISEGIAALYLVKFDVHLVVYELSFVAHS